MPFHLPSYAFFLEAIEGIYNKNTFLSIYLKKKSFYLCVACNVPMNELEGTAPPGMTALDALLLIISSKLYGGENKLHKIVGNMQMHD